MYAQMEKSKENKSRAAANSAVQKKNNRNQGVELIDNRFKYAEQKKLHSAMHSRDRITQRCEGRDGMTISTFNNKERLDTADGRGDGGEVTVVKDNGSPFPHYSIVLEWYNGFNRKGEELAAHMVVPEFGKGGQLASVMKFGGSAPKGQIRSRSWESVRTQNVDSTRRLSENDKETKRKVISREIDTNIPLEGDFELTSDYKQRNPKEYKYGLTGVIHENCKTWARRICNL